MSTPRKVNVTELRQNLPAYLAAAQKGKEIAVTSRLHRAALITSDARLRKLKEIATIW